MEIRNRNCEFNRKTRAILVHWQALTYECSWSRCSRFRRIPFPEAGKCSFSKACKGSSSWCLSSLLFGFLDSPQPNGKCMLKQMQILWNLSSAAFQRPRLFWGCLIPLTRNQYLEDPKLLKLRSLDLRDFRPEFWAVSNLEAVCFFFFCVLFCLTQSSLYLCLVVVLLLLLLLLLVLLLFAAYCCCSLFFLSFPSFMLSCFFCFHVNEADEENAREEGKDRKEESNKKDKHVWILKGRKQQLQQD